MEPIDPTIGELLSAIYFDGRRFTLPKLAPVVGGEWGQVRLEPLGGEFEATDDSLALRVTTTEAKVIDQLRSGRGVRNAPVRLDLADATTVAARFMTIPHLNTRIDAAVPGERVDAGVELVGWTWRTNRKPIAWVGSLDGEFAPRLGNLTLTRNGPTVTSTLSALRLPGKHEWFLLPFKDSDPIVVVTPGENEPHTLYMDLLCLEFSLGRALGIDYFVGVDEHHEPVAAMGLSRLRKPLRTGRCPVPDEFDREALWLPMMFQQLASAMGPNEERAFLPGIGSYIDAQSAHLDGAYLLVHIGLEALLLNFATKEERASLVRATRAWSKCTARLRDGIAEHLLEPGDLELILSRFSGAPRAPIRRVLDRFVARRGITLPEEIHEEMKRRNNVVHGYWMNREADYEIDRDARRVEMVQTLLAAVLAIRIGYEGPIKGYDWDEEGVRANPSWWPVGISDAQAERRFIHRSRGPNPVPQP